MYPRYTGNIYIPYIYIYIYIQVRLLVNHIVQICLYKFYLLALFIEGYQKSTWGSTLDT